MTPTLSSEASAYYRKRHLPLPEREVRPANVDEMREQLAELHDKGETWQILGDGQHTRKYTDRARTVIRTDELDAILDINEESGLVRVEAGVRWKELRHTLRERGFSLQRYGLHPASATVGGMLARHRPGPQALRGGELLDGCVAVGGHVPEMGDYRYLTAPRKASGPDLRHFFIGDEGRQGAILDATFVIWRPVAERIMRWEDCSLSRAGQMMKEIFDAGILPSSVHYSLKRQSLQLTICAPGQLLRSRMRWLKEEIGEPDEVDGEEAARRRRDWLEARHPDRRTHPHAQRTRVFWLAPSALKHDVDVLFGEGVADVEIISWSPQRLEAFARYGEAKASESIKATLKGACWADWPLINSNLD